MKRLILTLVFLILALFFGARGSWAGVPGIYADRVVLGTSLPLIGHASYLGEEVLAGMQAYFRYVNEQGGVYGRRIVLKAYDDAYTPPLMIGNVKKLITHDQVFALISLVGTPTTLTVVELCEKDHIPLLFPITGAIELRRPVRHYIFNLRPSYWDECRKAVDYFVKRGKRRFAVFYQRDAYGLNGLEGVRRRLLKYELDVVAEASYLRGMQDIKDQVRQILQAKPEVVALIGTAEVCANFVRQAFVAGAKDVAFFGVSFTGALDMAQRLKDIPARIYMTQVLPPCYDTRLPAVREYQTLFKKYFPAEAFSALSFEGFLNAKLFVYTLQKLGAHPTRETFIQKLQSFRNLDLGIGENISFSEKDHQGLDQVFLTKIKDGRVYYLPLQN